MAIRVLLVGRHEGLLEGLRAQLSCDREFEIRPHATGVTQAEACLRANEIDVVVVDGDCSLSAVLAFARQVRLACPSCGLLLIESTQVEPWRDADLANLVSGLIGRQDLPQCLPDAVRAVCCNKVYLSPEVRPRAVSMDGGFCYLPQQSSPSASAQPEAIVAKGEAEHSPTTRPTTNPKESRDATHDGSRRPEPYRGGPAMSLGMPATHATADGAREGFRERAARRAGAFHSPRPEG